MDMLINSVSLPTGYFNKLNEPTYPEGNVNQLCEPILWDI